MTRSFTSRLRSAIRDAERQNVHECRAIAIKHSSGPYSTAMLRSLGHPYATKRRGQVALDPAEINVQQGKFRDGWEEKGPEDGAGGSVVSRVENLGEVAGYLARGTSKMVQRPIDQAVVEELRPIRERRLREAVKRAARG